MKTFKELQTVLEDYNAWGSTNRSALSDFGTFYFDNPEQLARINSFIEAFTNRNYIDVRSAFNQLRARLNVVGIDFELEPSNLATEGTIEFPITRHGGSFGYSPNLDQDINKGFYKDNGTPGLNFVLHAEVTMSESGIYNIDAKIIPSIEEVEEPIETEIE